MTSNSPIWHPFTQKRFHELPQIVTSASGAYLTLKNGNRLLDLVSSWWVNLHGHAHPKIAKAIYDQALTVEQVLFASFSHHPALELSKKLITYLNPRFTKVYFSDNGSTAVEVALKMAYQYWVNKNQQKRKRFICFESAYHGDTFGAMSASDRSVFTEAFTPLLFSVDHLPYPNQSEKSELQCLAYLKQHIYEHPSEIAAILIEPLVQGAGGMKMCRPEFLQKLQDLAQENQILVIYDEVMVGFGRTGDLFACKKANTTPNLICLSKGLTGGFLPLAVTVCTEDLYDALHHLDPKKNFYHGHSYTANPLGCAAAIASLELLTENPNAYLRLEKLHRKYAKGLIDHPRFCGTIMAFEIPSEQNNYLDPIGRKVQQQCIKEGIFIRPLGNTIYFMPPYCIKEQELAQAYQVVADAVASVSCPALS